MNVQVIKAGHKCSRLYLTGKTERRTAKASETCCIVSLKAVENLQIIKITGRVLFNVEVLNIQHYDFTLWRIDVVFAVPLSRVWIRIIWTRNGSIIGCECSTANQLVLELETYITNKNKSMQKVSEKLLS